MSKADKMLKELGFIEYLHLTYRHIKDDNIDLSFYESSREYEIFYYNDKPIHPDHHGLDSNNYNVLIGVSLHLAIYEKMKELGWLYE